MLLVVVVVLEKVLVLSVVWRDDRGYCASVPVPVLVRVPMVRNRAGSVGGGEWCMLPVSE
jgi:hypothetical protein